MYKAFLIKYAEIAIKGKNRYIFEDALVAQIKYQLKNVEGKFRIVKEMGRIFIYTEGEFDYDETIEALKRVFGIFSICPAVVLEDEGFEKLSQEVTEYVKKLYGEKALTFKVNTRRNKKTYPMQSMEISSALGGAILDACPNMKVDVHNPDEIKFIYIPKIFRDRAVCLLGQTEALCFFCPVVLTALLLDI